MPQVPDWSNISKAEFKLLIQNYSDSISFTLLGSLTRKRGMAPAAVHVPAHARARTTAADSLTAEHCTAGGSFSDRHRVRHAPPLPPDRGAAGGKATGTPCKHNAIDRSQATAATC